jgi:hypothetical protein
VLVQRASTSARFFLGRFLLFLSARQRPRCSHTRIPRVLPASRSRHRAVQVFFQDFTPPCTFASRRYKARISHSLSDSVF